MNIAPPAIVNPTAMAFEAASGHLVAAAKNLEIDPSVRMDPRSMISGAQHHAEQAVALLEPHASSGDMFASRSASSSIEAAKAGIAALGSVAAGLADGGRAAGGAMPVGDLLAIAHTKFVQAEQALWSE